MYKATITKSSLKDALLGVDYLSREKIDTT